MSEPKAMTPLHIELLLHAYCSSEPHPRQGNAIVDEYQKALMSLGLIDKQNNGGFFATERGAVHIKQICALELPIHQWIGADGKVIEP